MTKKNEEVCDSHVELDECPYCEIEKLKSQNRWAELDIADLINDFGVHPLYWNGVHQACLNGTNVPVELFKTKQDCLDWCNEKNKDATETPTIEIIKLKSALDKAWVDSHACKASANSYKEQAARLQLVAGRYQFMFEAAQRALNRIDDYFEYTYKSRTPDQLKEMVRGYSAIYTKAVSKSKEQIGK